MRLKALRILALLPFLSSSAFAQSAAWPDLLWEQGQKAIQAHQAADAIPPLREIIAKYPASAHFTDAHEALGLSYLEIGKPKEAIPFLEIARRAWGTSHRSWSPTLLLIEALLESGNARGATLQARELRMNLEKRRDLKKTPGTETTLQEAILFEVNGRILLNQDPRADLQLKDPRLTSPQTPTSISGKKAWLELWIMQRGCDLSTKSAQSETQALAALEKVSLCARALTPLFQTVLDANDQKSTQRSKQVLHAGVANWLDRCNRVPPPARPPGSRQKTPVETESYREELGLEQRRRCKIQVREWLAALAKPERSPIVLQENLNSTGTVEWDAFRAFLRKSAEEKLGRLDP